ncbi:MAG: WYL domain-containing protein [Actinomycetota bacterium]
MPERKRTVPTTAERLGRILVVVPYLVKHPGTTLGEAARLFDVPASRLRRDLELVQMAGLPPYLPGDLIDVEIDDDDTVWVRMAEHFGRPLRLTRQEALAVRLRAAELLATPGVPEVVELASAVAKLDGALGESALVSAGGGEAPARLEAVRAAVEHRARVTIAYVDAAGDRSDRTVDPEAVFADMGSWYVVVWDTGAGGERLLRVDRILDLRETGENFTARGLRGAGRPLYTPGPRDVSVRLRLSANARWVTEYYATTRSEELGQGAVETTLLTGDLGQIARLLLRLGPDAEALDPPELPDLVRDLASRALAPYTRV